MTKKRIPVEREREVAAAARTPMTKTQRAQAGRKASPWNGRPNCEGKGPAVKFKAAERTRAVNCNGDS